MPLAQKRETQATRHPPINSSTTSQRRRAWDGRVEFDVVRSTLLGHRKWLSSFDFQQKSLELTFGSAILKHVFASITFKAVKFIMTKKMYEVCLFSNCIVWRERFYLDCFSVRTYCVKNDVGHSEEEADVLLEQEDVLSNLNMSGRWHSTFFNKHAVQWKISILNLKHPGFILFVFRWYHLTLRFQFNCTFHNLHLAGFQKWCEAIFFATGNGCYFCVFIGNSLN